MILVLVDQFAKIMSVKAFVPVFILKVAVKIFSSTFTCFFFSKIMQTNHICLMFKEEAILKLSYHYKCY